MLILPCTVQHNAVLYWHVPVKVMQFSPVRSLFSHCFVNWRHLALARLRRACRYGSGLGAQIFTGIIWTSFFFGCVVGMVAAVRVVRLPHAPSPGSALPATLALRGMAFLQCALGTESLPLDPLVGRDQP